VLLRGRHSERPGSVPDARPCATPRPTHPTSSRSRTPSPNSRHCCARPPSGPSLPCGMPSDPSWRPSRPAKATTTLAIQAMMQPERTLLAGRTEWRRPARRPLLAAPVRARDHDPVIDGATGKRGVAPLSLLPWLARRDDHAEIGVASRGRGLPLGVLSHPPGARADEASSPRSPVESTVNNALLGERARAWRHAAGHRRGFAAEKPATKAAASSSLPGRESCISRRRRSRPSWSDVARCPRAVPAASATKRGSASTACLHCASFVVTLRRVP